MSAMLREAGLLKQLKEQAETHAIELRAYEATVQNLEQRIREIEAQSVPVVGEIIGWRWVDASGKPEGVRFFTGLPSEVALRRVQSLGYDAEFVIVKPTHSITAAELATLREKAARLKHELETERMRLAACGVIALANTADSAFKARDMLPEYWSASAQDCASTVDREMDYRSRLAVAERERDELRKDAERYRWLREQYWNSADICVVRNPKEAVKLGHNCPSFERLDSFIDAAIAQGKGE